MSQSFICLVSLWTLLIFYSYAQLPPYMGDRINVHIVAHTHDDTGWVETTDEYYIKIVQWIFYTLIPNLENNANHKFSYVEMAFFDRWWNEQDENMRQSVLKLVNNQQLQMNLGGWCMNDEANPSAAAEIRQMTDGAQFILSNFGSANYPKVGWHIDPFGSSYVTAGMWSQLGFDAFGINRINYLDKNRRKKEKKLEFMWAGSNSLGQETWLWTHIMDSYYCTPTEIYFSGLDGRVYDQNEKWIQTNEYLPSYPTNYIEMSQEFIADSRNRVSWYKHNHILIPFGCDFSHFNAYMSYIQMDKLMEYINNNSTYNASVFYSTLYDYTKAVNALNLTWELEENTDFFNYYSGANQWWTGYYSSRADLKSYIRSRESYLRTAELLYVFGRNMENIMFDESEAMLNITKLRKAVDVSQHHDAITGTERDHVYIQYMVQMEGGTEDVGYFLNNITTQFLLQNASATNGINLLIDNSVQATQALTASNMVPLVLYNSLLWNVTQIINVGTNRTDLVVYDANNNLVLTQINPNIINAHSHSPQSSKYSLFFVANNLLPLSFTTYFIKQASNEQAGHVHLGKIRKQKLNSGTPLKIGSFGFYSLIFDDSNGKLVEIQNNALNKSFAVNNNFFHYGSNGSPLDDRMAPDDPYKFRPLQDNRYQMEAASKMDTTTLSFRQLSNSSIINPGFIVNAHISKEFEKNKYIIHVCNIDIQQKQFSFQFYSLQHTAWPPSNYYADWIIFDEENNDKLLNNKYYGSQLINKSATSSLNITINLNKYSFSTIPMMLTSIRKLSCNDTISQYVTTIVSMSLNEIIIEISRIDSNVEWLNDVYLDWVLWESNININSNDLLSTQGIIDLNIPSDDTQNNQYSFVVNFNNKQFIVNEPIILLQTMQTKATVSGTIYKFATTAINNNYNNFTVTLQLLNPSNNNENIENIALQIMYWSFERITLKENISSIATNTIITGPILDEIQQTFRTNYSQTYRVINSMQYGNDLRFIENNVILDWIDNHTNFVSSYHANNINNNGELYTCQNSLEYVKREYDPYCDERVACNFYPTSSQSFIKNENDTLRFSTIIDQAHGTGMDIDNGSYLLLLQRRCAGRDDSTWNGDLFQHGCLSPSNHSESNIFLLYDASEMVSYLSRRLYVLQQYKPLQFSSIFNGDINKYKATYKTEWNPMNKSSLYFPNGLPPNIHLLDLRYAYLNNTALIFQLWNMFEVNENKQLSIDETISINDIFDNSMLHIENITEMTLNAIVPLQNLNRLKWNVITNKDNNVVIVDKDNITKKRKLKKEEASLQINMTPRDIRTFIANQNVN